ncbi:MAG: N-acetylglucosamine-6-phosphate deacetylase [Arachnia sp.]
MSEVTVAAARVVTPQGVLVNGQITADDGWIVDIREGASPGQPDLWAVPGFVDTHCHGAVGVDFGNPDRQANQRAIDFHRSHGSTTLFASTVTEPLSVLVAKLGVLRGLVADGELAGIHLEGPFLAEAKKGAHDASLLLDPAPEHVERLIAAGGEALKMVTLAVERDHCELAVRRFREAGLHAAFGHSDATAAQARLGLDWGIDVATHLFNAMRPIHHRDPGPVTVLLTDSRAMNEIICDGVHLDAAIARLAIDAAGVHRTALITDAMSATGIGDGNYDLGGLAVQVIGGTARLVTQDGSAGAIAGSTLTMDRAFEFVVGNVGLGIPEAALIAATTPAAWHGLHEVGALEVGRRADVCVVDDSGRLHQVMRRGEWL